MWTLVKRELNDSLPVVATILIVGMLVSLFSIWALAGHYRDEVPIGIPIYYLSSFFILFWNSIMFAIFGSSQMRNDQKNKVSTFLSTLANSRRRIYLARVASGVLCAGVLAAMLVISAWIGFSSFPRVIPINTGLLWNFAQLFFCMNVACYAVGLQTSWSTNKYFPAFAGLGMLVLTLSIIVIKWIGIYSQVLLLLIAIVSFVRTWHKYESTSL